jgi:SWI/SNF related-matrix-associated actin-dependent regulator of chromatin subfamily C
MKHIKLNVLPQNQGTTLIDPENALGKCTKLDPNQAGKLSNLSNDLPPQFGPETGGKVKVVKGEGEGKEKMAEGDEEEAESGRKNDDEDLEQLKANRQHVEDHARKYLTAQTHKVIISSFLAWFKMSKIHPIEQCTLPEFLNL